MANEKIYKWLAGELSDSEKKEFESSNDFAELDKMLKALKSFKAPEFNIEKEYSKVSKDRKSIPLYQKIKPILKIAAVIIITLTIGYFSYDYLIPDNENPEWIAENKNVVLPDSSLVKINDESKIRYFTEKWDETRNVELKGEAFFKVKKGAKFKVESKQGTVSVLGTEFDVNDRDNFYEVTCYSGLVKVVTSTDSVLLKPNSVFRIIDGKKETYTISGKSEPDWLNGESSFKSIPFRFVVDELERKYDVSVELKNVDINQQFTGSFTHNNLPIALEAITIPVNLQYEINGNIIVISFEGK